jgi:hypothetical protein
MQGENNKQYNKKEILPCCVVLWRHNALHFKISFVRPRGATVIRACQSLIQAVTTIAYAIVNLRTWNVGIAALAPKLPIRTSACSWFVASVWAITIVIIHEFETYNPTGFGYTKETALSERDSHCWGQSSYGLQFIGPCWRINQWQWKGSRWR